MNTMEITLCQTGLGRHAPGLPDRLAEHGVRVGTVECFDKCETCELFLLVRLEGALARFRSEAELVEAVHALRADG